jgi:hypothetical protein
VLGPIQHGKVGRHQKKPAPHYAGEWEGTGAARAISDAPSGESGTSRDKQPMAPKVPDMLDTTARAPYSNRTWRKKEARARLRGDEGRAAG